MKRELSPETALRMLSNKPLALIGSAGEAGYNAAPVSWLVPCSRNPARIVLFLHPGHLTWENIRGSNVFTVNFPGKTLLRETAYLGGVSGRVVRKLETAGVATVRGKHTGAPFFPACLGHLECRVESLDEARECVTAVVVYALADETAFHERWRVEEAGGRPLQHLGGEYYQWGGEVLHQPKLRKWIP